MIYRNLALGLGLAALTACTSAEITTPPVIITAKVPANAVGVDVYARDRQRGNPVPRFRGQHTVQVRSFANTDNGRSELSGVPCSLDSGLFSATFATPANVVVPDYGPASPALFVRCTADDKSGSITVSAFNYSAQQRTNGAGSTGILGAIIITAVAAANRNDETDEFRYPPLIVNLR